ncbi:MAG: hypothetical protein ACI9K9_002314, partial [Neolewinella sp.]
HTRIDPPACASKAKKKGVIAEAEAYSGARLNRVEVLILSEKKTGIRR